MNYEQRAMAFWKPDFEELKKKHGKLLNSADSEREIGTPDEEYVILYWDYKMCEDPLMDELLKDIESIRHSIITIREDGEFFRDVECSDARGSDEEFEEILGWRAHICVWNEIEDVLEPDKNPYWV